MKKTFLLLAIISLSTLSVETRASRIPTGKSYTNFIGMKFVRIEPGTFRMGNLTKTLPFDMMPEDGGPGIRMDHLQSGDFDEKPVHRVTITRPFYMGIFEVTNYQYELFDPTHKRLRGKDEGLSTEDNEAVINVTWYNTQAFCRWLCDQEGLPYRLATEAEWEYACRAGTTSNFYTGEYLPQKERKHQWLIRDAEDVDLHVGMNPANPWGLYDMHGNVEEWCYDWYGPYAADAQKDPVGYAVGDFRVTRGGSHSTYIYYLRSANRMGAMPEDSHWLLGFRVVLGELPDTQPLAPPPRPLNQRNVEQRNPASVLTAPDPHKPYFEGPRPFVVMPPSSSGPVFALHNHDPAIVECPNGDLVACWYSCLAEKNRELCQAGSRLRWGAKEWEPASPFWDVPDRNDHAPAMWYDGKDTIYHFSGMSFGSGYGPMVVIMRTSKDSGATWSRARIALPGHRKGHMPIEAVFRMQDNSIALTSDASPTLWYSHNEGLTWQSCRGAIRGDHPGVAQLDDGRLYGLTRDVVVEGRMPYVISTDNGKNWDYKPSDFPPIHGGQRLVLLKLREGPLFFASMADKGIMITDADGVRRSVRGLFAAVSTDDGKTWPYKRLVTDDDPGRGVGSTNGYVFTMSQRTGEHLGYFAVCQGTNRLIHLISSRQHYTFNLKWAMTPAPGLKYPPMPVKHIVETFTGPEFDNHGWIEYKSFTGRFTGQGAYSIDSPGRQSGINRAVGAGSFEAYFVLKNFHFHPKGRSFQGAGLIFEDGLAAKQGVYIRENDMGLGESPDIKYEKAPNIVKIKTVWNLKKRRWRVFYGFNGEEPVNEVPRSAAGIYMDTPFTEGVGCAILAQNGGLEVAHCEITPLPE